MPRDTPLVRAYALSLMSVDAEWDAGTMGCGELIVLLRARVRALTPRGRLRLTAHDLGAVADIPAWCGLTGHRLVSAEHPEYLIERKED